MKQLLILTIGALMAAPYAHALSCMKPNIARTFNDLAANDNTYVLGKGTITPTEPIKKPKADKNSTQRKSYTVQAKINAQFMGKSGWGDMQTIPITVNVQCLSIWCGAMPDEDQETIAFLQKTDAGYTLDAGPCGGNYHQSVGAKETDILKSCFRKGKCTAQQIESLGGGMR